MGPTYIVNTGKGITLTPAVGHRDSPGGPAFPVQCLDGVAVAGAILTAGINKGSFARSDGIGAGFILSAGDRDIERGVAVILPAQSDASAINRRLQRADRFQDICRKSGRPIGDGPVDFTALGRFNQHPGEGPVLGV